MEMLQVKSIRDLLLTLKSRILADPLMLRILKNSSVIFAGNSMSSALGMVSFALMARQIGPDMLALLVLAQTYTAIFNDIFNIQTWESMVKFGADARKSDITSIVKTNLLLDFCSALVAVSFALIMVIPVVHYLHWDRRLIFVISLFCTALFFNFTSLRIGIPRLYDKFMEVARIQVVIAALKLICTAILYFRRASFMSFIVLYYAMEVIATLSVMSYSLKLLNKNLKKGWWKQKIQFDRAQITFIWWSNLRTIIRIPVRYFDVIVISLVMSNKLVGIYKVYKEIAGIMDRLSDPVNQAIYPEYSKMIGKKEIKRSVKTAVRSIMILFAASAIGMSVLLLISDFLVGRLFGLEYLAYKNALKLLLIFTAISFTLVPVNSLFIAAGFVKRSFYLVLFTNCVYLVTAYCFGKAFGLYGIVIAYGIQMILNQGLKIVWMRIHSTDWDTALR